MSDILEPVASVKALVPDWHAYFGALADAFERLTLTDETVLLSFAAERSDFVRFNHGKIRQTGEVLQAKLLVKLIAQGRQASLRTTVSGVLDADLATLAKDIDGLRASLRGAPEDPHLLFDTSVWHQDTRRSGTLPDGAALARLVEQNAQGLDFVGFYTGGTIARGFASSFGSRGWYEVTTFNMSWSLYDPSGRAIKTTYAGEQWSDAVFVAKLEEAVRRLPILARTPKVLTPGRYRSYLAPSALDELIGSLCWGGFSAQACESSRSVLQKLYSGEAWFDERVHLREDLSLGIAPAFGADGYQRLNVPLVDSGRSAGMLVNARSSREYGLEPNGANDWEVPVTLSMAAGTLPPSEVLKTLDTGLYIGNLWYVNISDRMNCRLTGMTRFATFWVEGGEIVAPVDAMRFDDSMYRILGSELEALTDSPELLLNDRAWGERATDGTRLPGALLKGFELTL